MSAIYRLNALVKEYHGRRVLDIPALEIYPGELLAVLGPSGAGKSTLLRLLNFLEPLTSGAITFDGQDYGAGEPPLEIRRRITTVFQRPTLLKRSVTENIAYGLHLRRFPQPRARIDEILTGVGLSGLAGASARTLSGGEAQRVALARALVLQPEVLLLDEPTANLDPHNVNLIEEIIREQRGRATLVLVTHNIFQARRLADRVALLLNGEVIECQSCQAFFESPQDSRTRAFITGEMVH